MLAPNFFQLLRMAIEQLEDLNERQRRLLAHPLALGHVDDGLSRLWRAKGEKVAPRCAMKKFSAHKTEFIFERQHSNSTGPAGTLDQKMKRLEPVAKLTANCV